MSERRYTLQDVETGKYWTGNGGNRGFFSPGAAGCYSYDWDKVVQLAKIVGGVIVEIIYTPDPKNPAALGHYETKPVCQPGKTI